LLSAGLQAGISAAVIINNNVIKIFFIIQIYKVKQGAKNAPVFTFLF
jgi:hypothetical protein